MPECFEKRKGFSIIPEIKASGLRGAEVFLKNKVLLH